MALENTAIQEKLVETFAGDVFNFQEERDIFSFEINAKNNTAIILFLKNDPELRFHFLTDLCGIHYPDNPADKQFAVVYHMHNWVDNVRIRIKCYLNGDNPEIDSVTSLFLGANWQERETYDFFGIIFDGHPDLRRILNMDDMDYFPMRKEYVLEDATREDKDDRFFGRNNNELWAKK